MTPVSLFAPITETNTLRPAPLVAREHEIERREINDARTIDRNDFNFVGRKTPAHAYRRMLDRRDQQHIAFHCLAGEF